MALPPEAARQREWVLDELARLLSLCGVSDFAFGPLYAAEERWFPDRWQPELRGAKAMLHRLMAYARLGSLPTVMRAESDPTRALAEFSALRGAGAGHQGAAAWFAGVNEHGTYLFGVETSQLGDPEALVGVLAHEVAHAWRFKKDLTVSEDALEERLTDLTTVFLGFGVLTTNNAWRVRSEGTARSAGGYGYLRPAEFGFALAVQLAVRGDLEEQARVLAALAQDQRIIVKEALGLLASDAPGLLHRLGLPPREAWPPPARAPAPVQPPARGELHEIVFRVRSPPVISYGLVGLAIGAAASVAALTPWLLLMPLGFAAAALLAKRDLCSGPDCGKPIPASQQRCPSCGGRVVGRIGRRRDHLQAEQDFFTLSDVDLAPQVRELVQRALRRGGPSA